MYEFDEIKSGNDSHNSHIAGFERAIEDFSREIKKRNLLTAINDMLKNWNENGGYIPRNDKNIQPLLSSPIPKMSKWKKNGFNLISLFSGALGLDLGFLATGFDLKLINDIDKNSINTINKNLPNIPCATQDIKDIPSGKLLELANIKKGEVDLITGGPPCQPFSTAGNRKGLNDPRASPLQEFIRIINEIKPRAFVMEEVTGLKSARLKHVPISERGDRELLPEEKKGSVFKVILEMLNKTGYNITYKILNSADYGSPQIRERIIFIGLRNGKSKLPEKTHSDIPEARFDLGSLKPWNTFWESVIDLQKDLDSFDTKFTPKIEKYLPYIPPGGYWKYLPDQLIEEAMGGAYKSGGGKKGFFRRLSWDEPSPTVVTSPTQKGSIFCHPESLRPLSINEYKRVQGFPDDWELIGSNSAQYKLIGNAVPVHLSFAIAQKVKELLE